MSLPLWLISTKITFLLVSFLKLIAKFNAYIVRPIPLIAPYIDMILLLEVSFLKSLSLICCDRVLLRSIANFGIFFRIKSKSFFSILKIKASLTTSALTECVLAVNREIIPKYIPQVRNSSISSLLSPVLDIFTLPLIIQ